jgi:hypothetical protein
MKIVLIQRPKLYLAIRTVKKTKVEKLFYYSKEYLMLGRLYKRYVWSIGLLEVTIVKTATKLYTDT